MAYIQKLSRYRQTPVYKIRSRSLVNSSTRVLGVWKRPIDWDNYKFSSFHVVTADEKGRLDLVAHKYYGDGSLWWAIADANNINNPIEELSSGTGLGIPTYQDIYVAITGENVGNSPYTNYGA